MCSKDLPIAFKQAAEKKEDDVDTERARRQRMLYSCMDEAVSFLYVCVSACE